MYTSTIVAALAGIAHADISARLSDGVGATPAMGFNNWNAGLSSSAETAITAANKFVSLGLQSAGYIYINTDDTWAEKSRSNGKLVPDPQKWPNGIKAVADQLHTMGFKMGLYGDSGTSTCAGYPGTSGYETVDADTLASWGIDLWKYDNCATPSGNSEPRYETMRNALKSSGRNIYYALCNWGDDSVWTWGGGVGNSWRVSGDVKNNWASVSTIAANAASLARYASTGGFNDFDMLEIGNGGLTNDEEKAHFGIWAIAKSPLLIGTDLTKLSSASLAILKNADIISMNQDSLGIAATYFTPSGKAGPVSGTLYPYWSGKLSDGWVIGLVASTGATTLSVKFSDVPDLGSGTYSWKECYSGRTGTGTSVSATLGNHEMAIFKVYKSGAATPTSHMMTTMITSTTTSAQAAATPTGIVTPVPRL